LNTALVSGAIANKPGNGGEAWVRLSWALGLRRLGLDAWLIEEIAPEICRDREGRAASLEGSENLAWFRLVTEGFGLGDRSALVLSDGSGAAGATVAELADLASGADLLVNVSGNLRLEPLLSRPRRRLYVDLDPGYTQLWHASGALGSVLERHHAFLTVGLEIGTPSCSVPTAGIRWRPVLPPWLLDEWPVAELANPSRFTTVGSWRGGYGRLEHDGRTYGQKAHEFRRFAEMPRRSPAVFEAALDIDPADHADRTLLAENGWQLVDPRVVAGDPWAYRRYIQGGGAEFSVAQGIYVETNSGWVGDRTAAYLASGMPALVQDTGLSRTIPTGEGLLTFRTLDEAIAGAEAIAGDYERHSRAARRIAEEQFDSDAVLTRLLDEALS
jgi:hypothetical protein